ncbi:MAG: phosphatidylglycerophosphatase A [Verrucomicrobiae bacterium]|nr:phosphatidylglycerophosphatase A [Verrucomicrobiae bacterium]
MTGFWAHVGLWVAQGLGVGRLPLAPGTWGAVLGVFLTMALLGTGSFWLYLGGILLSCGASIWLCGRAEVMLGQTDPGSVVLDEIIALPICFLPFVATAWWRHGLLPAPGSLLDKNGPLIGLTVFVLFRLFDILKPWPVKQSQALPGGWGITADDVLAALYTAAAAWLLLRLFHRHILA